MNYKHILFNNGAVEIIQKLDNGEICALYISNVVYATYDKLYHHPPVYLLSVAANTHARSLEKKAAYPLHTIPISEEEYHSDSFFTTLIDQYKLRIGNQDALIFLTDSPSESSEQLRSELSSLQQKQYVCPYQGGWQMIDNLNSCNYIGTINRYMRKLAEKNPADFSTHIQLPDLVPKIYSLAGTCQRIADTFNQIWDRDTRIFLFLYYHYCFTASLFGPIQSDNILCIDIPDQKLRSIIISNFFPAAVCENILTSTTKREFQEAYNNTNDIPFIVEEIPSIRNSTIGKLEDIVNKIVVLQRTPIFSTIPHPTPILEENFAVPILFTEQLHLEKSLYHIFLGPESFSHLTYTTPTSPTELQEYLNHFYGYFKTAFQHAKERAEIEYWPPIYIIFYTLYNAWENMCYSLKIINPLKTHDDPNCIDSCNTTKLLNDYLPKISTVRNITPQLFLDTLKKLADNHSIPVYKRLGTSADECLPLLTFYDSTKPYILENTDSENKTVWAINLPAFRSVLQNIPGQNRLTEVLQLLSEKGILESSNINSASYQKRYTIHTNSDGKATCHNDIALYGIRFPAEEKKQDPTQAPPYIKPTTPHFKIGLDMICSSNVYWDFEDEKAPNRHLLITGQSGCGKSFFLSKLIKQASEQKLTTVVIHLQGDLPSADNSVIIDMAEDKPGIDLDNHELYNGETVFYLLQKTYGIKDIHKSIIQGSYKAYSQIPSDTRNLHTFAKNFNQYKEKYEKTLPSPDTSDTPPSIKTPVPVQRMWNDIVENHFFSGKSLRWKDYRGKTVILDFRNCAESNTLRSKLATAFLTDLYRWQKKIETQTSPDAANKNPLILVIDEFQHLDTSKNSIINEILREGRKYGVSFWLASQTVSSENGALFNTCVKQAGVRIFFNSGKEGNKKIAGLLGNTQKEKNNYLKILDEQLSKGQFLFSCSPHPTIPIDSSKIPSEDNSSPNSPSTNQVSEPPESALPEQEVQKTTNV